MIHERRERLGPGAEIGVIVGEIGLLADHTDLELAAAPALADARVQNRRLLSRIGADDHQPVGLVDAGDRRVEKIARAAERGIKCGAILPAIDVGRAEPRH